MNLNMLIKLVLEGFAFLLISIFLFNEIIQVLQTLHLFSNESIKLIGMISVLLATDNMLSNRFLGIKLIK